MILAGVFVRLQYSHGTSRTLSLGRQWRMNARCIFTPPAWLMMMQITPGRWQSLQVFMALSPVSTNSLLMPRIILNYIISGMYLESGYAIHFTAENKAELSVQPEPASICNVPFIISYKCSMIPSSVNFLVYIEKLISQYLNIL